MSDTNTIIIGAGPAGLAIAGRMKKAGLSFQLLEGSQRIANAWHNHYDRLHLHTVKQWSHLPHMEFPESYPLYVPRQELTAYFENYAKTFEIQPQFGKKVMAIQKGQRNNWEVHTDAGDRFTAKRVVVATGINRVPNIPQWEGQEVFHGEILHSVKYKNAAPFTGKRVLVVGMGNTGAELALDLAEHNIETFISVRSPISIVPRDLNGRPVQVTSKQLDKLPFGLGIWLGNQIRKIYFGNIRKYGLEPAKMPPVKQLKLTGKTPVVDIGTMQAIKEGKIKVVKNINHFTKEGVALKTGEQLAVDAVILATGYRALIEDFVEKGSDLLDQYACPNSVIPKGFHKGLYFLGFDNYKLGGILGTIYNDSELIVKDMQK